MAQMGKLMDDMIKKGVLVTTGGILSRQTGMKVVRQQRPGERRKTASVPGSSLMPAAGYALMRANSREELAEHVQAFLAVAGDGTCEIIQVME